MKKLYLAIAKKIFPLPVPERRVEGIIPLRFVSHFFNLSRDLDYFCYSIFKISFYLGVLVTLILVLDIFLNLNLLITPTYFDQHKYVFISIFSMVTGPLVFLLSILFYLRIRLERNVESIEFTCIVKAYLLQGKTKKTWKRWAFFLPIAGLIMLFASHIFPIGFLHYFNIEENLFFVFLLHFVSLVGIAYGSLLLVYGLLILEAVIRYFPEIKVNFAES